MPSTPDPSPTEEELEARLAALMRGDLLGATEGRRIIQALVEAQRTCASLNQQVTNMQRVSAEHYADRLSLEAEVIEARESARVATRERDELVTERESWGDYSKHLETQLTDRDQMIAGLVAAFTPEGHRHYVVTAEMHDPKHSLYHGACARCGEAWPCPISQALSTSHPIAVAIRAHASKE